MFRMRAGVSAGLFALPFLSLLGILVAGCAKSPDAAHSGGIPAARGIVVSRVSMPAAGGQTIAVPQFMSDARALWSPLSAGEQQYRYEGPLPPLDMRLAGWLPKSEEGVMRSYLYRLTHGQSSLAMRAVARAEEHLPVIMRHVRMQGLPEELASLPLVESAFQARAVSPAGAAGLWQLMPQTARRFGLTVNGSVDERFDVDKASAAATAYLAFLYREFQDWPLAIAAYNCGEGKMRQALSASGSGSLSELTEASRRTGNPYLAEETLRFVPQFVAAVQIMQSVGGISSGPAASRSFSVQAAEVIPPSRYDGEPPAPPLVGRYSPNGNKTPQPPRSKRLQ